ncbi:hypothetical protein TNCV_2834961 [Trichonephila clavipes]|nr:hypothetical protein TNCV_2834961 [Trichonephila clavipes]
MADEDILKFVQMSKNIIDGDPDDENEMNNAAPVPTSSEMRSIINTTYQVALHHINVCIVQVANRVAKNDANLALSPTFRYVSVESPL